MDLVLLLLVIALIGFVVFLLTTKIPMPPMWATALQLIALIVVILFLLREIGVTLPNVLR